MRVAITSCHILRYFDPHAPAEQHTDASASGRGAVLVQRAPSEEHLVAYASHSLSAIEKNYGTTEEECLAVVWDIKNFRPYLHGRRFAVITDHIALYSLTSMRSQSGLLVGWALQLQEYDCEDVYRSGLKHEDDDALSRDPLDHSDHNESIEELPLATLDDINMATERVWDPLLSNIIKTLRVPA